jgi:hypothetical protein
MNHRELRECERLRELAPTQEELLEARDLVDAGLRLAFPQLFERLIERPPLQKEEGAPIGHEDAAAIGGSLLEIEERLRAIALRLPLAGHTDLHLALNGMLNEVDRLAKTLAERWGDA